MVDAWARQRPTLLRLSSKKLRSVVYWSVQFATLVQQSYNNRRLTMRTLITASLLAAVFALPAAWAQSNSPVGVWKTIDDETGKARSLVRITETNGIYTGKIEKLFREPGEEQNPMCVKCEGPNKDQPVLGMTILTDLKKDGDSYTGGQVLDPKNGKTYKAKLTVKDEGKKLDMRGYIGTPMLGRTQTWVREQ
jgi:uncharacterized protein (DUF2147 family)